MARGLDPSCPWDEERPAFFEQHGDSNLLRTLVVPPGHVWLEGDNPLCCVDSRHYGPVPVDKLEGKLFWRLFPLLRDPHIRKYDQQLRKNPKVRPPPLDVERPVQRGEEDVLAKYYNFYRVQPQQPEQTEEPPAEMQYKFEDDRAPKFE